MYRLPLMHTDCPIGETSHMLVVCDHQDRCPVFLTDCFKYLKNSCAGSGIQISRRFIRKNDITMESTKLDLKINKFKIGI